MRFKTGSALLVASATFVAAAAAHADTFSYAVGWPPNSAPTLMIESYAEAVDGYSDGEITVRVFPLSLLSFAEINAGIRDGIGDLATNLTPYFPSEYPNYNMLSEFSELVELEEFAGPLSSLAFMGAINEYTMLNCPACQEEFAAQNQVLVGGNSTTGYILQCMEPVETMADLEGLRVRAAGAYWARWAESMNAVPVSMSINETLEGLNQGVVDCTASSAADFMNFGFIDVVQHVHVGLPGALFIGSQTMNKDSWMGLSDEGRTAIMRGHAYLSAGLSWVYLQEGLVAQERAGELGISFGAASDQLVSANRAFIEEDLQAISEIYAERFGITNGPEALEELRGLLAKWVELTDGITSHEELTQVFWDELYSRIDVSTYGQ